MSPVTKFAARDAGPNARVAGFVGHLRANGLRLGVAETAAGLQALALLNEYEPKVCRRALRVMFTGCKEEFDQFDDLFDAYWMDLGRVRTRAVPKAQKNGSNDVQSSRDAKGEAAGSAGSAMAPDGGDGEAECDGEGKLIATEVRNLSRRDLRELVRPEEVAEAEKVASQLGAVLRDRRSRRRIAARKGDHLHFRNTIRRSLATGGEPIRLLRKKRPDRTRKITVLCDVSGSMSLYAKIFLSFIAGLMRADPLADAYLFHTRLVRITETLRDKDAMRAIGRMSLMADGFGGGSKIGKCLGRFANTYAKRFIDGRNVVIILSDGYDTGAPELLAAALEKIHKRGCRIIWLNPMKGWRDYTPITAAMAAAMAHIDLFAAANTLDDLAALERELIRL